MVCKHLPGLEEENRIMRQLKALSGGDLGNAYSSASVAKGERITADMLDSVRFTSYASAFNGLALDVQMQRLNCRDGSTVFIINVPVTCMFLFFIHFFLYVWIHFAA